MLFSRSVSSRVSCAFEMACFEDWFLTPQRRGGSTAPTPTPGQACVVPTKVLTEVQSVTNEAASLVNVPKANKKPIVLFNPTKGNSSSHAKIPEEVVDLRPISAPPDRPSRFTEPLFDGIDSSMNVASQLIDRALQASTRYNHQQQFQYLPQVQQYPLASPVQHHPNQQQFSFPHPMAQNASQPLHHSLQGVPLIPPGGYPTTFHHVHPLVILAQNFNQRKIH